ncbi:hypothetical protein ElyMa_004915100 [Elysia marginata]|uniref:Uncharacterized protein n=1 Tax=Elysia marginata TaxID=1093978 RepID=A0AAV4IZA9_9GAST|nr:hypothetical protein ElyMa_004915100 [Elysia marginata]
MFRVLHRRRQSHDFTYLPQQAYTHKSQFNSYFRALQYGSLLGAQILTFHNFQALPLARYPFYRWVDWGKLGNNDNNSSSNNNNSNNNNRNNNNTNNNSNNNNNNNNNNSNNTKIKTKAG